MHRRRLAALLLLAGCVHPTPAPEPVVGDLPRTRAPRPTTGEISPYDLMSRLYVIADDSMQGREAGTIGNYKATEYIAREMRRMGLQPGGENGGWFQTVPVTIARLDPAGHLAVGGAPLVVGSDVVPFHAGTFGGALPVGATTRSLDGATVIYGGQIGGTLVAPAQVAGKVVVFAAPMANGQRDWRFFATGPLTAYRDAAAIAVAALDVVPPQLIPRLTSPQERVASEAATGAAPLAMLVTPQAAQRMLGVPSLEGLTPGTAGATLAGTLAFVDAPAPYPARNVIGILPGSDPARRGEYVAIGAHNDHIGLERRPLDHDSVLANNMVVRRQGVQDPVVRPTLEQAARIAHLRDSLVRAHGGARADSVNNGADDDGSGTVALLEIAERFATQTDRPRRSILFVSHTGEEKGLWGSAWFTDHPTVPRDSIVAQLNMDMVGRGKATDVMGRGPNNIQLIGPRRLSTQLGALIDSLDASRTPRMDVDSSFDTRGHPLNRYCRSDHYMYARYGIPITYFSLGYHTDYHQVTDEPQYIDYGHMARIAQFVHDIAEAVANRPQRLVVDGPIPDPRGGCRQ